jgi:hypothetical protein
MEENSPCFLNEKLTGAYPSFHGTNSIKITNKIQPSPMKASLAGYLIEEKIHMIHILLL